MTNQIYEEFPKTAINRKASDVWAAAMRGPVSLSDHGTSRFVLMPRSMYDDLIFQTDQRIARATAETPKDEAEILLSVLDEAVRGSE